MAKITITLDQDIPHLGLSAGQTVVFDDAIRTADDGLGFYISQLAQVEPRIYETKYPNINFQELIPVNSSIPEWVDNVDYISYDAVTLGKFIGANADDLPNVAMKAKKDNVPVGYAGNSFEYSLDELRKSQQLRMPIDITLATAARRGAEEHMQRVAYFGDAERNMYGLFNHPNVTMDATSTLDWKGAGVTGKNILDEINGWIGDVWNQSKGVHVPNVMVLPANRWTFLATTMATEYAPDKTLLEILQAQNLYTRMTGQPMTIVPRFQLDGAGTSGKDRVLIYEKNADNLVMYIPMFWRPTAPQPRNLKIKVPAEYKVSGTEFRYPMSAEYFDLAAMS
ncbi:DUF2184 domain-containing protein [Bordetella bronchiseptica]|uniref:DUF2184 domain-containing protein n=1 Tax=Bordetella bronchiseptica TaxID=518 RepID=UPI00124918D1|nr:DUF2184 domain-containing protein [Bordetella bronchiseptica]KAB1444200.1 DUF2184 domain-containing protein [Bordetella bronchiseptica]KAB1569306.1 DUF2184 domain-containing protein [Bordetella bronchiseptica]